MRLLLVLGCVAVTGCMETEGQQLPSPAVQQLLQSCEAGNLQSCTTVAEMEQAERARHASIPPPVFQPAYVDPEPFMNRSRAPIPQPIYSQTTCRPGYGGRVICGGY